MGILGIFIPYNRVMQDLDHQAYDSDRLPNPILIMKAPFFAVFGILELGMPKKAVLIFGAMVFRFYVLSFLT